MILAGLALARPISAQVVPEVMGTKETAHALLDRMEAYVRAEGIEKTLEGVSREGHFIHDAKHYVAILRVEGDQIYVARHSVFDSLNGMNMTDQRDLEGRNYIQNMLADARGGETKPLLLEIPDMEGAKKSWCPARWAPNHAGKYILVVCY